MLEFICKNKFKFHQNINVQAIFNYFVLVFDLDKIWVSLICFTSLDQRVFLSIRNLKYICVLGLSPYDR